jgi:colanic acid/amylovoran biosynthesis glycosyltransferase
MAPKTCHRTHNIGTEEEVSKPMRNGPRVAMLRHTLFQRSEVFIPDQAAKLASPVTLVARDNIVNPRPGLEAVSFAPSRLARAAYTLGWTKSLDDCLNECEADLVHAHFGPEGFYSFASARSRGVPQITTLHGGDVTNSTRALFATRKPTIVRYGLAREKFFRNPMTIFVCVSQYLQSRAIALGVNPAQTVVIPTGVDTRTLVPAPPTESPVILHVARLYPIKGTATLLRAMSRVVQSVPDARLRIVGEGPLRNELKALVRELGLSRFVTFTGSLRHSEVLAEIVAAQVLAAPSETQPSGAGEGLGQSALEAAALGRPVVATDHGGLREAVSDGVSGILVAERQPEQLAEALVSLLADSQLREALGRTAVGFVRKNFDLASGAAALDALYARLV